MNGLEAISCLLERQDNLEKYGSSGGFSVKKQREIYETIERELKAFEIIKNKKVDVALLSYYMEHEHPNSVLKSYNDSIADRNKKLAQDEFDLLKEVMK